MPKLSVVIITLNEERNIGRCLESVREVADEIVVVDSFSDDRTEEICKEFNVRFIKHAFEGHIEQKNWAISQASYPHILSLDADELLSERLRRSIQEVKENWEYDGYFFNRLTNYCGKWIRYASWYPSRKLRLWDSRKGEWGGINPHDQFILARGSSRKHLKGDLLHYSYYSLQQHLLQLNKFSDIASDSYFRIGKKASPFLILFHPAWRFIRDYIFKLGFLDGYYGFIVNANSAYEVFLKYTKLREIYKEERRSRKQTICFFNSMDSWGGGEKWHYDVAVNLSIQNLEAYYISSQGSPLSDKFREIGLRGSEITISNLSFLNPFKVFRIAHIFRHENVGVVITSLSGDMKLAGISGKIAGVPKIIYRRGSAIPVRDTLLNRYMFRKVITRILANSLEVKRTILANNKLLVEEDKITIIYNGVDLSRYDGSKSPIFKASDGAIVLGSGGRLSVEKGHFYLIDLLKELEGNGIEFKMLIAGEGQLLNQLQKRAMKLGVERQLHFLGFVEDMPAFFNSLDIFLLTSRYEGFCNVIPEAMASRKPVVLFDIKSSSEIVEHGKTGYITAQEDVRAMAEHVLELAKNKELRDAMGARGRARVEEQFSFDQKYQEILKLITPR